MNEKLLAKAKKMLKDGATYKRVREATGFHLAVIVHLADAWGIIRKPGRRPKEEANENTHEVR